MRRSMLEYYPNPAFHTPLILNTPSVHKVLSIQVSNSRFCPIGYAHRLVHHLVHHRHSA